MQPEYVPVAVDDWEVICRNLETGSWDYDHTLELPEVDANPRVRFILGELLVWLWELVDPDDRVAAAPGLLKGFCETSG